MLMSLPVYTAYAYVYAYVTVKRLLKKTKLKLFLFSFIKCEFSVVYRSNRSKVVLVFTEGE